MSKVEYVGPRVEISNHGMTYEFAKEDKYIYLWVALQILIDIDTDSDKHSSCSHTYNTSKFNEKDLHDILKREEENIEVRIKEEREEYEEKKLHEIEHIRHIPYLTELDKAIWIRNTEIMQEYRIQRAVNKMYYVHIVKNIVQIFIDKRIKQIQVPFNKKFFHVLNTIKGALITGKPSLDAKVIQEYDQNNVMVLKLTIGNI